MDRREFLKAGLFSLSFLLPGAQGWAFDNVTGNSKHKLIVVFLRGAVDGINVVVPYGDSHYYKIRNSIAIQRPGQQDGVLDLDGFWGLNPALDALMPFWQSKQLAFIHASGSPDETRSHFDAQDYMESGMPGSKMTSTGWMNRLLSELPNNGSPVRAINFGNTLPRILSGPASVAMADQGMVMSGRAAALPQKSAFEKMYGDRGDALGSAFREGMEAQKQLTADLAAGSDGGNGGAADMMLKASKGAPTPNALPNFGRKIAKLLNTDQTVQIAFLALGGWDTHVNQGNGKGQLANKLGALGKGLAEMANGLGSDFANTTIVVMSEFGRTAHENGNSGTDHGHGNVMWVLGGGVNGGKVLGKWSSLADSDLHEGRDLPVTTDFRTVVTSLVAEHLELSNKGLARVFPQFTNRERLALLS